MFKLARRSPSRSCSELSHRKILEFPKHMLSDLYQFYFLVIPGYQESQKQTSQKERKQKKVKSLSLVQLFATPWTVAYHAPLSMGFSRQAYWSGLPYPSPGDLPDPGIKPSHSRQMLYHLSDQGSLAETYQRVC